MLRLTALLAGVTLLAACGGGPDADIEPERPLDIEASYRLLFNDALVGHAFFTLAVTPDGAYRIEAFTVPAGKMARADGHEVLETSTGRIEPGQVQPQRFDYSVMDSQRLEAVSLSFDWQHNRLQLAAGDQSRDIALLPGTQDRLSYLLVARRLAVAGSGAVALQVASPQATEETLLRVEAAEQVEVPAGRFHALAIHRVTPTADESRTLWFEPGACALPLRVLHSAAENRVEMVLERCGATPQTVAAHSAAE